MVRRLAGLPALALSVCCLAGCGNSGRLGEVSGTVTFRGNPVAEGTVSFMNPSAGTGADGVLKDGAYTLSSPLPPGEYKVTVMPLVVMQQEGGKGPEVGIEKKAPDIPQKYRTVGTTDLKATVKEGKQEVSFDLKP